VGLVQNFDAREKVAILVRELRSGSARLRETAAEC